MYTQKDVYPPKNCDIFYFGNHSTFNGNIHLSNQVRYFILNSNLNQFNTPLTIPESVKKLAINFNSIPNYRSTISFEGLPIWGDSNYFTTYLGIGVNANFNVPFDFSNSYVDNYAYMFGLRNIYSFNN